MNEQANTCSSNYRYKYIDSGRKTSDLHIVYQSKTDHLMNKVHWIGYAAIPF